MKIFKRKPHVAKYVPMYFCFHDNKLTVINDALEIENINEYNPKEFKRVISLLRQNSTHTKMKVNDPKYKLIMMVLL